MPSSEPVSRPGGRSARVLEAVYAAVGQLVGEGAERVSFPLVAERAGVNPTTLYRRWPDVGALLQEATVAALTREGDPVPDTGSLDGDLIGWATAVVRDIGRIERARFLRAMVSARTDLVVHCAVTERRREQAAAVIGRAAARGEAPPTVDQVLDHVIAPLYYRTVFALPVSEEDAVRLVGDVLAMAR
ncbi:TetR family transcriptional regulator [Curtobacterium sp. MCBD17_034]|uniref:TetR/AcrR family transcriptional regulator n=1 Tax=unclassified Curtobacterium TaxID=257496 RepID=UPI000DA9D600|nr:MULTISPECIES: TetR/AcrR family transcriptional regulator [unclassified Curtobacterium]PZF62145.1 TetR family transcriptional regulator [Curtobacterium sp. MCBD17_034]PZM33921.1 TetR family transcriptional regulator [Curtobacterium sp. MCBD17_031]